MSQQPRIIELNEKKLAGRRLIMSFAQNRTKELWQSFMPKRRTIPGIIDNALYSVEVYHDISFFEHFNPAAEFEKWAAVEVQDISVLPQDMECLLIPKGLYAVFIHKGPASNGFETYNYIYSKWLPESTYKIDMRPHFALMGDKYKQDEADSEEDIYIPVQLK